MKIILLSITILLASCVGLFAQVAFPTNNAIWTNTHYDYTFNPPNPIPDEELTDVDYYCVTGEDTIIQSITYTKVFYCGNDYKGALRDDNGIVYFVPADSTNEYLLYDFTAQQGQMLSNVYVGVHYDESFILQDFTVQQIGTEIFGGVSRRVVYADNFRWIEGIGCETGLFMEPWQNVSMYRANLECMSVDGATIYPTDGNTACSLTVGIDAPSENLLSVSLYPNPHAGAATLQFGSVQTQATISIVNQLGQLVEALTAINTDKVELNLSAPNGIYFVKVVSADGLTTSLRMVKY